METGEIYKSFLLFLLSPRTKDGLSLRTSKRKASNGDALMGEIRRVWAWLGRKKEETENGRERERGAGWLKRDSPTGKESPLFQVNRETRSRRRRRRMILTGRGVVLRQATGSRYRARVLANSTVFQRATTRLLVGRSVVVVVVVISHNSQQIHTDRASRTKWDTLTDIIP